MKLKTNDFVEQYIQFSLAIIIIGHYTAMRSQNSVSVYITRKQTLVLHFVLAEQYTVYHNDLFVSCFRTQENPFVCGGNVTRRAKFT